MTETKKKTVPRKAQKFFFDVNHFDDDFEEEVIFEEPPPPVFSEEELAAAKEAAFNQGREEALAEAKASRGKYVADLLGTVTAHFQTLFAAEQLRATQYEGEAVLLAHAIFEKLFPTLNRKQGLNEIETMITTVLNNQRNQQEIIVEVHPDYSDSIQKLLETLTGTLQDSGKITVRGNDKLGPGDCRMVWDDGGAGRDVTKISEEIHRQLEHMLADKPTLQDNRGQDSIKEEEEPQQENSEDTANGEDQ